MRKQQLKRADVPVLARVAYGTVETGFMRDRNGYIYFLAPWGDETIPFPVLDDNTICCTADLDALRLPTTIVDLVAPKSLGISKIIWAAKEIETQK